MAERPEQLAARWRAAEARLYPVVFVDPPRYELYLRLVRAVADDLAEQTTDEQLARAYEGRSRLLASARQQLSLGGTAIDEDLVLDAAFGARHREMRAAHQRAEAERRIAAGQSPGWVLIGESGPAGPDPAPGYRRLEMHLPDGMSLHTFIEHDPGTYLPCYGLELLQLDPRTGEFLGATPSADREEFGDRDEWRRAVERARRFVETGTGGDTV